MTISRRFLAILALLLLPVSAFAQGEIRKPAPSVDMACSESTEPTRTAGAGMLLTCLDGTIYSGNGSTWTKAGSGGGGNPFDQDLNTTDAPTFAGVTVSMTNPTLLATLADASFASAVTGVYVQGNYAYAKVFHGSSSLSGKKHFLVVDISNRAAPRVVGSLPATSDAYGISAVFSLYGSYAFIANGAGPNHLEIIDIADPTAPVIDGVSTDALLAGACSLAVQGHYAYVGACTGSRLVVVDVVDPAAPVVVGSVQDVTKLALPLGIAVQGNYAYVAGDSSTGWVTVVNIEDPTAPTIVGSVSDATTLNFPASIAVVGSYAYVCRGNQDGGVKAAFTVLDVSDPSAPAVASTYRSDLIIGGCNALAAAWPYVAVVGYTDDDSSVNSVTVLDVSVPTSTPVLAAHLAVDPWAAGTAGYVTWAGRDLIVTTYEPSFNVLSLGGSFVSTLAAGSFSAGFAHVTDSLVIGNYLSVGSGVQVGERGVNSQGPLGGSSLSITGIAPCPAGQTAAVTWSTDVTGHLIPTRGSCS